MSPNNQITICWPDETQYSGKFISQKIRPYTGTDGEICQYEIVARNNVRSIVAGLPVTRDGDFLINRQFRIPLGRYVFENTAGLVDEWETLEEAMIRELAEETGYYSDTLHHVAQVPTSSWLTDELVDCFILLNAVKSGESKPENSESIETLLIKDDEIDEWFLKESQAGNLIDPKVMMLVSYYRRWIKDPIHITDIVEK